MSRNTSLHQRAGIEGYVLELDFGGFQVGQIAHVLDQAPEFSALRANAAHALEPFAAQGKSLVIAQHDGHRRKYFAGHIHQDAGLGSRGCLGGSRGSTQRVVEGLQGDGVGPGFLLGPFHEMHLLSFAAHR